VDDPAVDADIPRLQRRSFLQLKARACRWPVGDPSDPNFFFCGAQRSANKPFCAAHCRRAYRHNEQGEGKCAAASSTSQS
jgi:GcrA cell cycle regulator